MGEIDGDKLGRDVDGETVGASLGVDIVGENDGDNDGTEIVGDTVGVIDGIDVVGEFVADSLGAIVGGVVGGELGLDVDGNQVGDVDGFDTVGEIVGDSIGDNEGLLVSGDAVGEVVGVCVLASQLEPINGKVVFSTTMLALLKIKFSAIAHTFEELLTWLFSRKITVPMIEPFTSDTSKVSCVIVASVKPKETAAS